MRFQPCPIIQNTERLTLLPCLFFRSGNSSSSGESSSGSLSDGRYLSSDPALGHVGHSTLSGLDSSRLNCLGYPQEDDPFETHETSQEDDLFETHEKSQEDDFFETYVNLPHLAAGYTRALQHAILSNPSAEDRT